MNVNKCMINLNGNKQIQAESTSLATCVVFRPIVQIAKVVFDTNRYF